MNPTREPVDLCRMAKNAFKIPSFICIFLLAAAACRSPKPAVTIELSELTVARIHAAYENGEYGGTGAAVAANLGTIGLGFAGRLEIVGTRGKTLSMPFVTREEKPPSISVLPFVNMSNNPDQDYFSDGMMEEILDRLFKIGDLKGVFYWRKLTADDIAYAMK